MTPILPSISSSGAYVLPIGTRWLYYHPLGGVTALINTAAVRALRCGNMPTSLCELVPETLIPTPTPPTGALDPPFLGIIPTRRCNIACRYCGFGAGNASDVGLDPALALRVLDWYIDLCRMRGRNTVVIQFFGGEPFIARELVETVVHYMRMRGVRDGFRPWFEASTNGVFDTAWCQFVSEYFDRIVLSLDGPAGVQNLQRPACGGGPTFHIVDRTVRAISGTHCDVCLRTCVTADTVAGLAETVAWMCETYTPSTIDVEVLQTTKESAEHGLAPPAPVDFARAFLQAVRATQTCGVNIIYAAAEIGAPRATFCPVGRDVIILSPDGMLSTCYLPADEWHTRGLELALGHATTAGVHVDESAVAAVRGLCQTSPRCGRCFARWTCAGGCHVNHGTIQAHDYTDFCIQTRLILTTRLLERVAGAQAAQAFIENDAMIQRLLDQSTDALEDWE